MACQGKCPPSIRESIPPMKFSRLRKRIMVTGTTITMVTVMGIIMDTRRLYNIRPSSRGFVSTQAHHHGHGHHGHGHSHDHHSHDHIDTAPLHEHEQLNTYMIMLMRLLTKISHRTNILINMDMRIMMISNMKALVEVSRTKRMRT